jgi:integrase
MTRRLTALQVENAKPSATRREISDGGSGLYLIVQPSGHKSFAVRTRINGKPVKLTLPAGLSLADARVQASAALKAVEEGNDPIAAKKQAEIDRMIAKADTFASIAAAYLDKIRNPKNPKTYRRSWDQTTDKLERLVFPVIGARPIREIRRREVYDLLAAIEQNNGNVQADRTYSAICQVFNFMSDLDEDFVSPLKKRMRQNSAQVGTRVLSDDEIPKVWAVGNPIVNFALLTGARRDEIAGMTWGEIHGSDWLLPASRNKIKVDLLRPLSKEALAIINAQPRNGPFVFPSSVDFGKPFNSFDKLMGKVHAASGTLRWSMHDLRRTVRTRLSKAGVSRDHAKLCLGQTIGDAIDKHYDHHDYYEEKKRTYEILAGIIGALTNPPKDNVRQLKRRA